MTSYNYAGEHSRAFTSHPLSSNPQPVVSSNPQPVTVDEFINMDLKVLNQKNKKEFRLLNLRHISPEFCDSPTKIKEEIYKQYSENVPLPDVMELGYFYCSKKYWLNNRLDVNDLWELVANGKKEKVVLWCVAQNDGSANTSHKRQSCDEENSKVCKKSRLGIEEKRELAEEYEQKLKEKHADAYSKFQYKLWAEMLSTGVHTSLEEPPSAAMFSRDKRSKPNTSNEHTAVMDGMVTVIDTLCQVLTPKKSEMACTSSQNIAHSPIKKAELRSIYMRQLNELKALYDANILKEDEYEEQRKDIVKLMRQLN